MGLGLLQYGSEIRFDSVLFPPLSGISEGNFLETAAINDIGAPGMKMSGHHGQRAKPAMPILRQHRATPRREPRNSRDMD